MILHFVKIFCNSIAKHYLIIAAKNIALAGVRTLTLNDIKPASWLDLSTNFYIGAKDIGVNRADVCIKQISELNPNVKYQVTHEDLGKVDLSYFDQFKVCENGNFSKPLVRYSY